jgi:class 3 adenylate cyclase
LRFFAPTSGRDCLPEWLELIELPPLAVRGLNEPVTVFALQIRQETAK